MSTFPRPIGRKESVIRTLKLYERMYKDALKLPATATFNKTEYLGVDYIVESSCWLCEYASTHERSMGCDSCPFFTTYHSKCFNVNSDIAVEWLSKYTIKWALRQIYGLAGHFNYYTYKYFKEVHENDWKEVIQKENNLPKV